MQKETLSRLTIDAYASLLDAIRAIRTPVIEVHLSDPATREEFRHRRQGPVGQTRDEAPVFLEQGLVALPALGIRSCLEVRGRPGLAGPADHQGDHHDGQAPQRRHGHHVQQARPIRLVRNSLRRQRAIFRGARKVCLVYLDHLSVNFLDLAPEGHVLPARDAESLGHWFEESASSGSLERYLETFDHTVAVMQTAEGIRRVARECVEDLAEDGVVYAEVRYAPEQHLEGGLSIEQVVEAVKAGFEAGEEQALSNGKPIVVRQLLTAMRHQARSREIAELVVRYRDEGVLGFDIAGAEAGFPPTRHLDAFEYLQRENAHFTIHAGEGFGLPSIWQAIQWCGADRLGHGVRIIDDIEVRDPSTGSGQAAVHLGRLASYVRDKRIPLEMCPSSNIQTGAAASIAEHPIGLLTDLRFRVTVNTDNRLMSATSMSREMALLVDAFGYTMADLRWFTINAMKSAFLPFDERLAIIDEVIKPAIETASGLEAGRDFIVELTDALQGEGLGSSYPLVIWRDREGDNQA